MSRIVKVGREAESKVFAALEQARQTGTLKAPLPSTTPFRPFVLKHNPALHRHGKLIAEACWSFSGVNYQNDAQRRLLRMTFLTQEDAYATCDKMLAKD